MTRDERLPGKPVYFVLLLSSQVTDEALKELAAFKKLTTLMLINTQVTYAGLKELAALKNLTSLSLYSTQVTDAGVKELKLALLKCQIVK